MRASCIAFAAIFIAAAACTDSTSPAADSLTSAQITKPPQKSGASAAATVPASLYSSYSPTSPHWSHITTMMTDFYYAWTTTERAWAGAHYDFAMSGTGSAWRAANPSVGHYPYALSWTTMTTSGSLASSYYADMKSWFSTRPQFALEKAFVHKKG
ncbi:MAG: hypothetical protein ABI884_06540, partial [Gemmatimonadota bacterium]